MIRLWWLNPWGAAGVAAASAGGLPWVAFAYQRVWREQQAGDVEEGRLARVENEPDPRWDDVV